MDQAHSVLRAAKLFFFGTLMSRFSGLLRDMAMAFCFGSTPEIAAFMVAYRLANLFRRFFGEGNMAAGFVPAFEHHRAESLEKGASFYRDAAGSMGVVLAGAVAVIELVLWGLKSVVGPEWLQIIDLSMWMAPGLFFICLFALDAALLQCQKKSFWAGVAPVAFNFAWIGAALFSAQTPTPMKWLAIGVTGACCMQWIMTQIQVKKEVGGFRRPTLFTSEWKAMIRPMALGLMGVGAMQINSALDAIFARIADSSGPAFLWYAIRIQQLPLALFGIALSGALLPPLSRAMKQGDLEKYRELLKGALKSVLALMIPCTFGLFALGRPGLNLLYGRGDFSSADVESTLQCLWAYGIGLVPAVFVLILAQGFYAKKSYAIPSYASVASVLVNGILNAWLVFGLKWGPASIALATSASALVNWLILARALQAPTLFGDPLFRRLIWASALPAALSMWVQATLLPIDPRSFTLQAINFGVSASLYGIGVLILARVFKIEELFKMLRTKEARVEPPR
jgi:putative peptidoglycan lipid II flippase